LPKKVFGRTAFNQLCRTGGIFIMPENIGFTILECSGEVSYPAKAGL